MTRHTVFRWNDAFREAYGGTGGGYKALANDLEIGLQKSNKLMSGVYDPPQDCVDAALLALREKLIGKATKILKLLGDVEERMETLTHENDSDPGRAAAGGDFHARRNSIARPGRGDRFRPALAKAQE